VVNEISVRIPGGKDPHLLVLRMLVENNSVPAYKKFHDYSRFKFSKKKRKANVIMSSPGKLLNILIKGTPVDCSQFYALHLWRTPEARFL